MTTRFIRWTFIASYGADRAVSALNAFPTVFRSYRNSVSKSGAPVIRRDLFVSCDQFVAAGNEPATSAVLDDVDIRLIGRLSFWSPTPLQICSVLDRNLRVDLTSLIKNLKKRGFWHGTARMISDEIRFGPFRLDLRQRILLRHDEPVRLGRRPLGILCELASAGGSVVSKDALLKRLWAGRIVEEGNIHVHVSALRKALDDLGDGDSYVVTIPGRGYRLVGLDQLPSESPKDPSSAPNPPAPNYASGALVEDALNAKPSPIEKRQLTVVSCELIGAACLAEQLDPEDLSELIAAFYQYWNETIAHFGGVVTRLAGDEMLAYFGYPHAREHDAEQAVRAGLALIGNAGRLGAACGIPPMRLGIATGPVVVGVRVSSAAPEQGGLVGETLTLATALRRIADPNTVVIAENTRRLVGDLFDLRILAHRQIEGFSKSIDTFEVVRPSALHSRFEALHGSLLTPLVGREEELELLLRRWQRVTAGEMQVVLVSGEPGIGKSRLTVELQKRIRMERHVPLRYFCSPHHQDSALYPVIRQLEDSAGFDRNDTTESKIDKLKAVLMQVSAPEEDMQVLAEMMSLLPGIRVGELTPRRKRELTFEALIRQVDATAQKIPVLMVFEDVHWSDPTTLELLDLVIQRIGRRPILLLITFRPEFAAPWTGRPQVTSMFLRRLDRKESAELVRGAVGVDALTTDVVEGVAERADGIPLFLEELSKTVAEAGTDPEIEVARGGARSARALPATLQASLMERFDRLTAATKEVAQVGAAIGREFSYELVAEVCGQLNAALDTALENLVASGLAFRHGIAPNAVFVFKHGLVQDAIYSTLSRSKRQRLHAQIAQLLERILPEMPGQRPELLGHHFTEAGQPEIAIRYWRMAVEQALRTSAYREAVGQCMRGLQTIQSITSQDLRLREEAWLHLQQGIALTARLGPSAPEMREAFNRACEIAEQLRDEGVLAGALLGLWAHHNARASLRPALALARRLYLIGERLGRKALCVQAHAASLTVNYKMGAFKKAWRHFELGTAMYSPSMEIIEAIPNYTRPGPDMLLHASFVAWVMGYPERASKLANETMTAARKLNQPYTITHCVYMLGHLAELQDDWQAVRRANEETVELATRWGFTGTMQLVSRRIALVAVAIDHDQEQFRLKCEHRQPGFARSLHDVVLARMCAELGIFERGLKLLDETLDYSQETGSCFYDAEVHRTKAKLLAALGHSKEAESCYVASIETAKRQGARMWELRAATNLAEFWAENGERRRAADMLGRLCSQFTEGLDVSELRIANALLQSIST